MTSMPSLTRTSMSASSTPGNSAETLTSLSVSATSTWTPELSKNEPGQPAKGEKGTLDDRRKSAKARLTSFCSAATASRSLRAAGSDPRVDFQGMRSVTRMSFSFYLFCLDADLLGGGIGRLGDGQAEHAVLQGGVDVLTVHLFGKDEAALIGAVAELDVGGRIALRRIRRHASRNRQDTLVERDIEARGIGAWNVQKHDDRVALFEDVGWRREDRRRARQLGRG